MARSTNYADKDGKERPARKQGEMGTDWDAPFRGYINLDLDAGAKAKYPAWAESQAFWEALEYNTAAGVNFSLKWEIKKACFLASGTQRNPASPNAGLVVTARGRDAATAWGRLLYCLTILNRNERWEVTQPLADPDRL